MSDFTKRVKKSSGNPTNILPAIALSLREDYDIDCMLFQIVDKQVGGYRFVGDEGYLIVIQISDFTALCVAMLRNELCLFKIPLYPENIGDDGVHMEPSKIYWERQYELANPNNFDDVLRIIRTNYNENSSWPHKARKRASNLI